MKYKEINDKKKIKLNVGIFTSASRKKETKKLKEYATKNAKCMPLTL